MNTVEVALLSLWIGFAVALQVTTHARTDEAPTSEGLHKKRLLGRLVYMIVGLAGMLGVASLIGSVEQFQGPAFPLGCAAGVATYWAATKLGR